MFDLGDSAIEKYGYPYLTVYRPDLLGAMVDKIKGHWPNALHLGMPAIATEQDEDSVTLTLADNRKIKGDILIGTDGVKSTVRDSIWGDEQPNFYGLVAWRGVIPMERLPKHMQDMVGSTWIGPGGHMVNYPLRGGQLMNMIGTIENNDWKTESWHTIGTAEECARDFNGWHEDVQSLIEAAPSLMKWAFLERKPRQKWSKGRISLLGDACHATLPFLAQGAVMSIEDGVCLRRSL